MIGGGIAVKIGDSNIVKVRGASMGGADIMSGGYLEHAAMRADNCVERLSLVNSHAFVGPDADDSATTLRSFNIHVNDIPNAMKVLMELKLWRLRGRCDLALKRFQERRQEDIALDHEEIEACFRGQVYLL